MGERVTCWAAKWLSVNLLDGRREYVAEVLAMYGMDLPQNSPSRELVGYHMKALLPFWGERTLADVKGSTCRTYLHTRNSKSSATNAVHGGSTGRHTPK